MTPQLHLDAQNPFVVAVCGAISGDIRARTDAVSLLQQAEQRLGIGLLSCRSELPMLVIDDADVEGHLVDALLDACPLPLAGDAFLSTFTVTDRAGRERLFFEGEWGRHVAKWANRELFARWRVIDSADAWRGGYFYSDFKYTGSAEAVFPEHRTWLSAIRDIVERKVELFGPPFPLDVHRPPD